MNCRSHVYQRIIAFVVCMLAGSSAEAQQFQVLTRNYDNQRTGANVSESVLKPSNVNPSQFGKLFVLPVDDQIYAGLLYATDVPIAGRKHNVVYVATVSNSVYAFDADQPAKPLWYRNFNGMGRPTRNTEVGQACQIYNDFIGNIGIVGTPVIGPNRTMYFVTRTVEAGATVQRLHAIDIASGQERPHSPQAIQATVAGTGEGASNATLAFNPVTQNQRAALAFADGIVYIAWASFCDTRPYHGWMMAYDAATLAPTGVFNASPNGNMSGIWMSGAGPVFDHAGNLFVSTGNGTYDGTIAFGETMVKLQTKSLRPLDFFVPSNYNTLNEFDLDFGTQGPTMLPGTNLLLVGAKEGKMYLLDADNLGGESRGDLQIRQIVQAVDTTIRPNRTHHMHNSIPAWKSDQGVNVYVWGENDFLRAYRLDAGSQKFALPAFAMGPILLPAGMPGGMMTISAKGSDPSSGIIWATAPRAGDANQMTVPGNLYAFDAQNLTLLWSSVGAGDDPLNFAKGSPPIAVNGKVYVASLSNSVSVYGPKAGPPNLQNLALNRKATGSAPCEPGQTADKAFNGSAQGGPTDKWCSSDSSPFLQVDLGGNFTIGRFVVEHAGAGGDDFLLNTRDFNIEVSTDGSNVTPVAAVTGNIQSITTHDVKPVNARYVRLNIVTPTQIAANTANIYELAVFAPVTRTFPEPDGPPPPALLAMAARDTAPVTRLTIVPPVNVAAPPADAQYTASGLAMQVLQSGSGTERPVENDCVRVSFNAWERTGALFSTSSSVGDSEDVCLSNAIMGIGEALRLMVPGEKRRVWVPADLTFGNAREARHHMQRRPEDDEEPPHKDLTFDVELVSILKGPTTPADLSGPPASALRTPSGLAYQILKSGTGTTHPSATSRVTVHFSCWTRNGRLFETTIMGGHPALVPLAGAMAGWREGLSHMVVGDKARFWIPAALAYGEKPANRFSPAGDLIYEIELLGLQ